MTILRLLTTLALACALVACQKQEAPKPAPAPAPVVKEPTREEAMNSLMEVPELKAMSEQIEHKSHGKTHGAVIEDDPQPRIINGQPYWQFSFVENAPDAVHRRASFLVAKSGNHEILVEDPLTEKLLTLPEWRRTVRKVEAH